MKFSRLLVLCEANICRSPLAASLLQKLTNARVDSAGLTARPDDPADPVYLDMAQTLGLTCPITDPSQSTAVSWPGLI